MTRRAKLVARLEEQRALALDPGYAPTRRRTVNIEDGTKRAVETRRGLRPWWHADAGGGIILTVRYGFETIEFERGTGIAVPAHPHRVRQTQALESVSALNRIPQAAGEQQELKEHANVSPVLPRPFGARPEQTDRGHRGVHQSTEHKPEAAPNVIDKPAFFPKILYKARARIAQAVGKLKRFKRIALRCEKTAQNYSSFVALAFGFILVKTVHTA